MHATDCRDRLPCLPASLAAARVVERRRSEESEQDQNRSRRHFEFTSSHWLGPFRSASELHCALSAYQPALPPPELSKAFAEKSATRIAIAIADIVHPTLI
jgi:hypothetical protein